MCRIARPARRLPRQAASSRPVLLSLRDGGHGRTIGRAQHATRNARVVAQVTLAFMVRCFWELRAADTGFEPEGVPTFRLPAPPDRYEDPESVARFHDGAMDRFVALLGITATDNLPLTGGRHDSHDVHRRLARGGG